ncbi:CGLAU_01105 family protein [Corynebacterium flavescens]|uniref:CGLAU_01105 family protein n=1 Tax=Corynebacterium flavescens TaxID=28028 RepID=UPI0028999B89|nr:CGLAU_01105 family protein [Corynebacterium flavescens]
MTDKKSLTDSLKEAGSSAFEVAKEFGGHLKADRAKQAEDEPAGEGTGNSSDNVFDKVSSTAKDLGATLKAAAEATRTSEAFADAKGKINTAYNETREGVSEAYKSAKERSQRAEGNATPDGPSAKTGNPSKTDGTAADGSASPVEEILEGEVIETDHTDHPDHTDHTDPTK